ncbi:MAG: hypothetical protein KME13_11940 [Myxacorys californica WJT36-NPBG1]|nr:hypothetical protein [Myxacorys californica WJT36-NPBG1]
MSDEPTKPTEITLNRTTPEERKPEDSSPSEKLPQSPEEAQDWLEKSEKFVKLVAENLRYGSWSKRFVTIGGVAFLALNPISAQKVGELFFGMRDLPEWYVPAFWMGMGGVTIGAVGAAVVTLPKRILEPVPERQAIKGLRSFEQKDAEIFKRLERQRDVQDCLDALDTEDLRLFLLMGESGVGKSSLLQAGLMPNLGQVKLTGVYVKLSDRDPIELIRKALGAGRDEAFVAMLRSSAEKAGKPIVLILDQFEQFFVQFQEAERGRFIGALKEWYESDVPVKILIGIRGDLSDRLIEIQKVLGYSVRPSQVQRLEKFAPEQATRVLRVIAETEKWSFNEAFVQEMARDELAGRDGKVAPVEVQVLAQMVSREPSEDNRRFDQVAFQKLGGVDGLLGRSLQRSLDAIPGKSERERALEVLLALTDLERNVRSGAFSIAQLQGMTEKVHGSPSEVKDAVAWLSESRLITPGDGDGEVVYELAHERLIPALRQVANQELSEASRANLLLDRRVNEWLGSGKSRRYLFSVKELWLLQQQRGFLTWGVQRGQKQELLRRSWKGISWTYGLSAAPFILLLCFGGWSYTSPGQIQWTRWNLIIMANMQVLPSSGPVSQDLTAALNLDMVSGVKNNPVPSLWLNWFVLEGYSPTELSKIVKLIPEVKDRDSAKSLLHQVEIVVGNTKSPDMKPSVFSDMSQVWVAFGETQKAQQLLSHALDVTKSIKDESSKAESLQSIAEAYGKLGDAEQGKQLLVQVLNSAKSIKDESSKAESLQSIAEAYGKLGDAEQGKQLLAQALNSAKSIESESSKAESLQSIAEAYGKLGDAEQGKQLLVQVLNSAKSIKDESSKAESLQSIAEAYGKLGDAEQGKQLLAQALNSAKSIKDESSKAESLQSIAEAYGKLGDAEQGKQLLVQVLNSAKSIESESSKAESLQSIAEASGKLGDAEQGKQLLAQALNSAKSIKDESSKAESLQSIAEASGKLGDAEQGKQLLAQALNSAKSIKDESSKAESLQSIAEASGKLGDAEQGKQLLAQALNSTKSIESESRRAKSLQSIAEASGKLGDAEQGKQLLAQALNSAKSIKDESSKAESLQSIAEAYGKLGDAEQGKQLLVQVLNSAKSIESESRRAKSLQSIAEAYGKLGDAEQGKQLLAQALNSAKSIESESSKAESLQSIAQAYFELGDLTQAKNILVDATKNVDISQGSRVSKQVAQLHAELGNWGEALRLAQRCNGEDKVAVLARILQVHAEQKHPEFKALRDKKEEDE